LRQVMTHLYTKVQAAASQATVQAIIAAMKDFVEKPSLTSTPSLLEALEAYEGHAIKVSDEIRQLAGKCIGEFIPLVFQLGGFPRDTDGSISQLFIVTLPSLWRKLTQISAHDDDTLKDMLALASFFSTAVEADAFINTPPTDPSAVKASQDLYGRLTDWMPKGAMCQRIVGGTEVDLTTWDKWITELSDNLVTAADAAQNLLDTKTEADLLFTIQSVEAVAGGAAHGAHWLAGSADLKEDALMSHFQATLDKVDHTQFEAAQLSLEKQYSLNVECLASPSMLVLLARAAQALKTCRVTQLECQLLRTAKKSRQPSKRCLQCIAEYNSEEGHVWGDDEAFEVMSAPVKDYMINVVGVPLPADSAVPETTSGVALIEPAEAAGGVSN